MRGKLQTWLPSDRRCCRCCGTAAAFVCALIVGSIIARRLGAEISQPLSPIVDVDKEATTGNVAQSGPVRFASGQKATAQSSNKVPVHKAATTKSGAGAVTEKKPPQPAGSVLPLPRETFVPLAGSNIGEGLKLTKDERGLITLIVRDRPLSQVLSLLAQTQQLNVVAANDIDATISITLQKVPLEEALTSILAVANYTWVRRNNIILITSLADSVNLPADVQGRQIQVFNLDFISASSVSEAVQNFLSPIGKVSISSSSKTNNRLTQERIVVEDLPESLERIASYIAQVDHPPRQVLIEAHVLQVTLDDTTKCGVNLSQLMRVAHSNFTVKTTGFADSSADQAFLATLDGGDLGGVIEALETTTDAKTLGSPKLLVLNEQEARLQVGQHLGFKTTMTTQTNTQENVQFLDVGVVLRITPRITRDGSVLLHVRPEVSKGDINPKTGLPESDTAELETDVMLNDGQGMVIGGLIKENDSTTQSKVPYLGNVKGVGWLFRHTEVTKERVEIIVALVPRVQPYDCKWQAFEQGELVRAGVPLFHGPLCRTDRPWDAILPDGKRVQYPLVPNTHPRRKTGYFHDLGPQYAVPPYPLPDQHLYSDSDECEIETSQMSNRATMDRVKPEQELPLPDSDKVISGSTHVISDQ
jgi:type IV pilus assembly protein PilQ